MKIKSLALLGAVALSIIPMAAFADLKITNNTDAPATAFAGNSPCSSSAPGGKGVIQPNGGFVEVPDWAVGIYCSSDCRAEVFMSKNCSGKPVATCIGNKRDGIKSCNNHDKRDGGYRVEGYPGKNIRIEGRAPAKAWYQKLLPVFFN